MSGAWALAPGASGGGARFPLGVASGDPGPHSVVLWTRVGGVAGDVEVTWEVGRDPELRSVVARGTCAARADRDHTTRAFAVGLEPASTYWYRFRAGRSVSPLGRTRTAPAPGQDVAVRFAVACCQDFVGRYYHAWRLLARAGRLDFVLFLGDYIYETTDLPDFQVPTPGRTIHLPDGMRLSRAPDRRLAARTLADYRALYRQYRSDPALREIHRSVPFVAVQDDHEFANDCWQDHSCHFDDRRGDEKDTARREAANRAWLEYVPTGLPIREGAAFPADLRQERTLRFGRHVELVLNDQRSHRSDHVIPEGPPDPEVGKPFAYSALGSRVLVRKEPFDRREAAVRPTMLGARQLAWTVARLRGSSATWKVLASQAFMGQMLLDLRSFRRLAPAFRRRLYFKTDQWDGYRSERAQLLRAVAEVEDLVVLSGDLHGAFASTLHADFDEPGPASAVEYTVPGISSISLYEQVAQGAHGHPLLARTGLADLVPRLDEVLRASNPHLHHVRSDAFGFGIVEADGREVRVELTRLERVTDPRGPGAITRTVLRTPRGRSEIQRA